LNTAQHTNVIEYEIPFYVWTSTAYCTAQHIPHVHSPHSNRHIPLVAALGKLSPRKITL